MEIQDEYGVKYHRYWFNEDTGEVWSLAEAPNKEAAEATHREAHGLVADEIVEVKQGSKSLQRGGSWGYGRTAGNYYGARQEPKFPRRN